jgi:hypothetical protein
MGRIRTVKPELAKHEVLFDLEQETGLPIRFAWVMLFTVCDREGRFEWRPRRLKTDIIPYDDIDVSRVLDAWVTRGLVVKYRVGDAWFGCIPTFTKHQVINNREAASDLPDPASADEVINQGNQPLAHASATREPRVDDATPTPLSPAQAEGKGREGKERGENRRRFTPPTLEEVTAYIAERRSPVDPQRWMDHYTAKGWVVGKSPMKDWQASVRTWERDSSPKADKHATSVRL